MVLTWMSDVNRSNSIERNCSLANDLFMTFRSGLLTTALVVGSSGCQFDHDTVDAGYYGQAGQTALSSMMPAATSAQGSQGTAASPSNGSGGSASASKTSSVSTNSGAGGDAHYVGMTPVDTGAGGMTASNSAGGSSAVAGMSAAMQPSAAGTGGTATSSMSGGEPATPSGPCDMSGRWLSTVHYVTDALGQLQYAHAYIYYELAQQAGRARSSPSRRAWQTQGTPTAPVSTTTLCRRTTCSSVV
jgi:hypothetical protein